MTRNVYIARHGHREDFIGELWNAEWQARAERQYDPGLSETGIIQAKELGKRLAAYDVRHLFASPFLRTVETAHYVAEALECQIKIEAGICEWLNPGWFPASPQLLSLAELCRRFSRIDPSYHSRLLRAFPEHNETSGVWPRMAVLLKQLLGEFEGDLLFIGHGSSVAGLARALGGDDVAVTPRLGALIHFQNQGSGWSLLLDGSA
jgi:broad specificity phosphatase PhoE